MNKILLVLLLTALCLSACESQTAPPDKSTAAVEATPACVVTPPSEPMMCTMDWRPVCGCNGVTYSNPCGAKAAGVPEFTEGECKTEKLD